MGWRYAQGRCYQLEESLRKQSNVSYADNATQRLVEFIAERHSIYKKKAAGKPKPWTEDKILQTYRFCNVYRELDTVTQWISENWRTPANADPDLWFNMVIARLVNWPGTLEQLEYTEKWNPKRFVHIMEGLAFVGKKVFSGAYIVSTNGVTMPKAQYLAERVLTPLWNSREGLRPRKGDSLSEFHARLMKFDGMGSFLAAQVVADVKYAAGSPLRKAPDWETFAASGPGSRRGLNRVIGREVDAPWKEQDWHRELTLLRTCVNGNRALKKSLPEPLHAQDLQNCLCEFDKMERVRLGEGRPRSLYPGV
jgi:hypothetical protein